MGLLFLVMLGAGLHPLTEPLPGPDSPSTAWVLERLTHWRPGEAPTSSAPIALDCLLVPGQPDTVGVGQDLIIQAPLAEVAALVEDFAHYVDLFPDLNDVHKVPGSEDGNRFAVSFEQRVPVFFIPNVRYETTWLVERTEKRISYRYKLKEKGAVRATDGLIVLEALGASSTRYTEVDFIDAATGPLSSEAVWELTLGGIFRSDVALKLKAEHPAWGYVKVKAETEKLLERFPTRMCFEKRHPRPP